MKTTATTKFAVDTKDDQGLLTLIVEASDFASVFGLADLADIEFTNVREATEFDEAIAGIGMAARMEFAD